MKTENQVLRSQLKETGKRLRFTDEQRRQLVIKAKALGKRLFEVVTIVRPETILRWHKKLIAQKFDSSKVKRQVGRPKVDVEIEQLVMKFSGENQPWVCALNGNQKKVVAGPRIELGTRGFSVLCSTD